MIHADAFEDSQVRELNSSVILCNYIPTLFGELGFELERRLPSNLMQFVINWWPGRETVDSRIRRFTLSLSLSKVAREALPLIIDIQLQKPSE